MKKQPEGRVFGLRHSRCAKSPCRRDQEALSKASVRAAGRECRRSLRLEPDLAAIRENFDNTGLTQALRAISGRHRSRTNFSHISRLIWSKRTVSVVRFRRQQQRSQGDRQPTGRRCGSRLQRRQSGTTQPSPSRSIGVSLGATAGIRSASLTGALSLEALSRGTAGSLGLSLAVRQEDCAHAACR